MSNAFQILTIGFFACLLSPQHTMAQTGCVDSALIDPDAICITLFDPVCGCNGVTYNNSCEAQHFGGVTSWTGGPCNGSGSSCDNLHVNFSWNVPNPQNLQVFFTDLSQFDGGQILGLSWDFGDGHTGSGPNPVHAYDAPGVYTVCLEMKAIDAAGNLCQGSYCAVLTLTTDCFDNCLYDFEYNVEGSAVHAYFDFGPVDPPFFFYVSWSLDNGALIENKLDFVHLFSDPGLHTLCATYPTGDFSTETCTVCKLINVTTPCANPDQIDSSAICPLAFIPVCGCDGNTYENACSAYYYGGITSWLPGICGSVCNNLFADFEGFNSGGSTTVWTFNDISTFEGGTITSWNWDFGNGQTATDENPTINFLAPGTYQVCLSVTAVAGNGASCSGSICKTIVVPALLCIDINAIDTTVFCPAIYDPVCGCDGVTYPNECVAYKYNGVTSWTPGVCPNQCVRPDLIDSTVNCIEIYDPVCGCNEVEYDNACYAQHYGGVTSWQKGKCCDNPACNALFGWTFDGPAILFTNFSTNAEAMSIDFGDGTPVHTGVFDTISHYYQSFGGYQVCLDISNFAGDCSDTYCAQINIGVPTHEPLANDVRVRLTPNPANAQTLVRVDGAVVREAVLYDIYGKTVWSGRQPGSVFELDTQALPPGMYLLNIRSTSGLSVEKLLVSH